MRGRIRQSVAFAEKGPDGEKHLVRSTLVEGLGLTAEPGAVTIFRDVLAGVEHVREISDLRVHGFRVVLDAYATHVYMGWREIGGEAAAEYRALAAELGGAGVPSVEAALVERRLRPLHDAVAIVVNEGQLRDLVDAVGATLAGRVRIAGAATGSGTVLAVAAGDAHAEVPATAAKTAAAEAFAAEPAATPAAQPATPAPTEPAVILPDLRQVAASAAARCADALRGARAATGTAIDDASIDALAKRFEARLRTALLLATDPALGLPQAGTGGDSGRRGSTCPGSRQRRGCPATRHRDLGRAARLAGGRLARRRARAGCRGPPRARVVRPGRHRPRDGGRVSLARPRRRRGLVDRGDRPAPVRPARGSGARGPGRRTCGPPRPRLVRRR